MKILKRVFGLLWSAVGFVIGVFLDSLGDDAQSTQKDMYHPDDPYNYMNTNSHNPAMNPNSVLRQDD